jgi:hypothetical protein
LPKLLPVLSTDTAADSVCDVRSGVSHSSRLYPSESTLPLVLNAIQVEGLPWWACHPKELPVVHFTPLNRQTRASCLK